MSKHTALLGIVDDDTFKTRTKATHAVGGFMSKFKSRGGDMAAIRKKVSGTILGPTRPPPVIAVI